MTRSSDRASLETQRWFENFHDGEVIELGARQVTREDFTTFDYILAMDEENLYNLTRLAPANSQVTLRLFLSYAPDAGEREVPDPYYDGRFEYVYSLVMQAAGGLLAHIRRTEGL